jgi:hypothetical protein
VSESEKQCYINYINVNIVDNGNVETVNKFSCDIPAPEPYTE